MTRLYFVEVYTLAVITLIFIAIIIPVNCKKHKVSFDPNKMLGPCKGTKYADIRDFFDLSKLKISVATDDELAIQGSVSLIADVNANDEFSVRIRISVYSMLEGKKLSIE